MCKIAQTHSNAFVDLNGDCLADLFVVCSATKSSNPQTFQIWLNDPKTNKFTLHSEQNLPKGAGQITFADFGKRLYMYICIYLCT